MNSYELIKLFRLMVKLYSEPVLGSGKWNRLFRLLTKIGEINPK